MKWRSKLPVHVHLFNIFSSLTIEMVRAPKVECERDTMGIGTFTNNLEELRPTVDPQDSSASCTLLRCAS